MAQADVLTQETLRTPKAAAIARMLFSLLTGGCILVALEFGAGRSPGAGLVAHTNASTVALGLNLRCGCFSSAFTF